MDLANCPLNMNEVLDFFDEREEERPECFSDKERFFTSYLEEMFRLRGIDGN